MKKNTILLKRIMSYIFIILILIFSSCQNAELNSDTINEITEPEKIIIRTFGVKDNSLASYIVDFNNLEYITELSTQIMMLKVLSMDEAEVGSLGNLNFQYTAEIMEIYLDTSGNFEVHDEIHFASNEGMMKAKDAAKLFEGSARAKKLGILQGEYADNEYIASSNYNAVPIEVGKTYIVYLSDEYLESDGSYTDIGRSYLYEVNTTNARMGYEDPIETKQTNDIISQIKEDIQNRTGRVDEIGPKAYRSEITDAVLAQSAEIQFDEE